MREHVPCIIAGKTAIYYWLHNDCAIEAIPVSAANRLLRTTQVGSRVDVVSAAAFGDPPYEVLVVDDAGRRNSKSIHCLTFSLDLPRGSLVQLSSGAVICSPAFAFCQACRSLAFSRRVELGMSLCASYWLDWLGNIQGRRHPLTSAAHLARFFKDNASLYGSGLARSALRWVKDGSASPMETKLMVLLSLPPRHGGFGFRGAQFNYRVNPGSARNRVEQNHFMIDIAFPGAKVGIEFDGAAFHRDFCKDRRRINGLESLGWRIVSVDKRQLYNAAAMQRTAKQIAKLLGARMPRRDDWEWLHAELRRNLSL